MVSLFVGTLRLLYTMSLDADEPELAGKSADAPPVPSKGAKVRPAGGPRAGASLNALRRSP